MKKRNSASRVIGYIRVSTDDQQLGPVSQLNILSKYCCERLQANLVGVFSDLGVSGADPIDRRPGLLEALRAIKEKEAGILLVAKRDRIARDLIIGAMIERQVESLGAIVVSADGTGNGDAPEALLMRNIVTSFAEYERQLIRARTKAALGVKKARNERVGQIPIGKKLAQDGRSLEVCDEEEHVLKEIMELKKLGMSYNNIVNRLNSTGVPSRGSRWHVTTVRRIFARTLSETSL